MDNPSGQIKFWAFLGPIFCLTTLCILYNSYYFFPRAIVIFFLISSFVCWRWKIGAFFGSTALLLPVAIYYYQTISLEEQFWFLGVNFSILLSLFITALSSDEVDSTVEKMMVESRSRLENLWKVDEKKKRVEEALRVKEEELAHLEMKIRSYQKIIDISAEELIQVKRQCEILSAGNRAQPIGAVGPFAEVREAKRECEREEKITRLEDETRELYPLNDIESALGRYLSEGSQQVNGESPLHELFAKHLSR